MRLVRRPGQWRDRGKSHHCSFAWKEERNGVAWKWLCGVLCEVWGIWGWVQVFVMSRSWSSGQVGLPM